MAHICIFTTTKSFRYQNVGNVPYKAGLGVGFSLRKPYSYNFMICGIQKLKLATLLLQPVIQSQFVHENSTSASLYGRFGSARNASYVCPMQTREVRIH